MDLPNDSCDSVVLARSASGGDGQALRRLLERYLPELRAFVRLRSGAKLLAREAPEDLVQSVCREVLGELDSFDYRSDQAFKSWLFVTALHKVQDKARYYAAEKRDVARDWALADDPQLLSGYASMLSPSRVAMAREDVERLELAFEQLSPEYREVITLHRLLGLEHDEIARRMGRTTGASRVLLHRALARLGRLLGAARSGGDSAEPPEKHL